MASDALRTMPGASGVPAPPATQGTTEGHVNTGDAPGGTFTGVPEDVLERTTRVLKFADAQREAARSLQMQQEERRRKCSRLNNSCGACGSARDASPTTSASQRADSPMVECSPPPIPGLQIESLDEAAGAEVTPDASDDSLCEVCQCEYEDEDEVMLLPCSHFFHKACISRWLTMKTTCPKCRYALSPPVPESREVRVRRTTTIEWMPVLQWVPASTTTVEVRTEEGSDMETVTTTTTRPVMLRNAQAHEMSPEQVAAFYQVAARMPVWRPMHSPRHVRTLQNIVSLSWMCAGVYRVRS